jgi:hypothetical protein
MNQYRIIFTSTLLLLMTGCAQLPQKSTSNEQAESIPQHNAPVRTIYFGEKNLLDFSTQFIELTAEEQRKEVTRLNQASQTKSDLKARMQLGLALSVPGSRVRDSSRALSVFEELLNEKDLDAQSRLMATILRDHLSEASKMTQKVRDESKRADTAQQKLDDSQKKLDDLQKKLNDLKNIEKTMVDRDQGTKK